MVFLKSIDQSNKIKDHKYIFILFKSVIKEIMQDNVVQVITNNGSTFVKANKLLMKKYNIYWNLCLAHSSTRYLKILVKE